MYHELIEFGGNILKRREIWLSGEFLTSIAIGIASFVVFHYIDVEYKIINTYYEQSGNILTVTSILFGFAITSFIHYVQIAESWSEQKNIQLVAEKLVDWNAWTVICILFLILYMMILIIVNNYIPYHLLKEILYSVLSFFLCYCLLQLICHTLTTWYLFQKRSLLHKPQEKIRDEQNDV
ncbi:MAG: hypothetical protein Q4D62_12490 [Planctomycetia bacterium]|nr:hypothetical protein [Planctomycetia bacterium]